VPNGALLWYLDATGSITTSARVTARINKSHYGTSHLLPWLPFIPEMAGRPRILRPTGTIETPGAWSTIVAKVCFHSAHSYASPALTYTKDEKIENGREYTKEYTAMNTNLGDSTYPFACSLYIYRDEKPPLFLTQPGKHIGSGRLALGL
jgi:hypothetical protein